MPGGLKRFIGALSEDVLGRKPDEGLTVWLEEAIGRLLHQLSRLEGLFDIRDAEPAVFYTLEDDSDEV